MAALLSLGEWLPPTRARYEQLLCFWQLAYPLVSPPPSLRSRLRKHVKRSSLRAFPTGSEMADEASGAWCARPACRMQLGSLQWLIKWYGMGKTSQASKLNLPGRVAWLTMEAPGMLTLLYVMKTLPTRLGVEDLPWQNRVLAGLFVMHYVYRAILFPILQPSMAPIHLFVWLLALSFQLCNATCLGGWLAGYGPVTQASWAAQTPLPQFVLGLAVFYAGLAGNFFHDDVLRDIRRRRGQDTKERRYEIPRDGLFRYLLYPHYFCEWIEWTGFLMAAGWSCTPAWAFLTNEICSMLPRAVRGKRWYVERFGVDKVGSKWAVIPGLV